MRRTVGAALVAVTCMVGAFALPTASGAAPRATETLGLKAKIVASKGTNFLHVDATGKTGTAPSSGRVDVVLYGNAIIPEDFQIVDEIYTVVAHIELTGGKGSTDVPITSALIRKARPPYLLHTFCCTAAVRRPGTGGVSSPYVGVTGLPQESYYGPVIPSSTMLYLDVMSRAAVGHALATAWQVPWAAKLAAGASRAAPTRELVESSSWRRYRATLLYQRWLGRRPTASEQAYWADRLTHDTTSKVDLAMASKPAARDAGGTTNAKRGAHLATALHLPASYGTNYTSKLDGGASWATVVHDAYWSSAAVQQRINDMGPRSSFTPSLSSLGSQLRRSGDERAVEIAVLATLPTQYNVVF